MRDLDPIFLEKRINELEKGGGGTTNYNNLSNKPKIENVELTGNKTFEDLGIASAEDLAQTNDDLLEVTQLVNGMSVYSEDETVIGMYLGKPLYRKVVKGTTPSQSSSFIDVNFLDNVDKVVNRYGSIFNSSGWNMAINSYQTTEYLNFLNLNTTTKQMYWEFGTRSFYNNSPYELIIEYTKTTD